MDLKDKIKQLNDRLEADNPTKTIKADEAKTIERNYFVSLSFDKRNEVMQKLLPDMLALGFKQVAETNDELKFHTDPLKENDARELHQFMEKIKKQSSDVFYDLAFDHSPDSKIVYSDLCKAGYSQVYSSMYHDGEQTKNIEDHLKTAAYLKNLFAFEEKLISPTFKTEFCDRLIATIKDSIDVTGLTPTFLTEDPVRSFVYEVFDFTVNLGQDAMLESHSQHYPHLYMIDTAVGYKFENARNIRDSLRDVKPDDYHQAILKIMDHRFIGFDTLKGLKTFQEMKPFPKILDTEQTSDESDFSIHYFLSTDHMNRGYGKVKEEICRIIVKTALEYIQINKAHEIHIKMSEVNASRAQMAEILVDAFAHRVNVREWQHVLGEPIQAPSAPDAYFVKRTKRPKPV